MPQTKYIRITIDGNVVDVSSIDQIPVSISYALEDRENFQMKKSGKALSIIMPATLINSRVSNNFINPAIHDLTTEQIYRNHRRGVIEANGQELISGKAFMVGGEELGGKPLNYEYDFYGDNADWLIDLKESTLFDFVKDLNFIFSKSLITSSWNFDGTDLTKPYVFAPVRYAQPMESFLVGATLVEDYNMPADYLRPALSKYWIIYNAFKSLGYTIRSDFFDEEYFRRQVMPWTWGNFLMSEGTKLDNLDFLAKSSDDTTMVYISGHDEQGFIDLHVDNDSINGAFDNNSVYDYDAPNIAMRYVYNPIFNYGLLSHTFYLNIFADVKVTKNSYLKIRAQYFKNGIKLDNGNDDGNGTLLLDLEASLLGSKSYVGPLEDWLTVQLNPGDVVTCKIWHDGKGTEFGMMKATLGVDAFELDYIKIPFGGTIAFDAYMGFKKHKFLDFLSGVIDEFNLCVKTDSVNKIVYFEPEHPYSLVHDQSVKQGGYFNGKILDWSAKHDMSKITKPELFSSTERELEFKYKEDTNDGAYKIYVQRHSIIPGYGKYVFPDRFKVGKKEIENRFFSPVMHYDVVQWKGLGSIPGDMPQMISLVPENISNTSKDEAQNNFMPKSAYYKGLQPEWGWVFDGETLNSFPFMFAVNYKTGGHNDPILSYCDEHIGTLALKTEGVGLIRRFYLQRIKIMENGQYYKAFFKLNNSDIANILHREHIAWRGQKWEIVEINDYRPLQDDSTEVYLRKWVPITDEEN